MVDTPFMFGLHDDQVYDGQTDRSRVLCSVRREPDR